jgi:hypothetical protein
MHDLWVLTQNNMYLYLSLTPLPPPPTDWEFSAETIAILFVEIVVALMTLKKIHTTVDALLVLSLYPISLILVAVLEAHGFT